MEFEAIKEIITTDNSTKKQSNNNRKNYKKGPRRKITQLVLYCGAIPFKGLTLLEGNYKTLCKKIDEMRTEEENVLVKQKEGEIWFIGFSTNENLFQTLLPENFSKYMCDLYEKYGKRNWRNAKGSNDTTRTRIARNSETIMFMDRLPVSYMPEEKAPLTVEASPLVANTFYTPREVMTAFNDFLATTGAKGTSSRNIRASRMNGFLTSNGGNYLIYNFSDWTMQVESGYEIRLNNLMDTMLIHKGISMLSVPIILYRNERILKDLLIPRSMKQNDWIQNLEHPYKNVYAVPLTQTGQQLAEIMCMENWQQTLYSLLLPKDRKMPTHSNIVNDGIITHTDTAGNKIERYVFLFCVPDIKRFRKFLTAAKATKDKKQFEIRCFDYQEKEVRELSDGYAYVNVAPFDKVYTHFIKTASAKKSTTADTAKE